jgi:GPI mannosyltransferase 3
VILIRPATIETGLAPGKPCAASFGRRADQAGLVLLVFVAIGLRLIPVELVPTIVWPDEIFQTTEQAHRLVFGTGLVPWEFRLGVRSWLLPGLIAGIMELSRLAGDGPDYYLPAIALGFAALAAVPVICCFLWGRRLFGASGSWITAGVAAVAPELVFFGARTLSEVVAGHLLVAALYVLEPGYRVTSRQRIFLGGALLGLVVLLRIQLFPAFLVVVLWTSWRMIRQRAVPLLLGAAAALAGGAIFDFLTLGSPLASLWRYCIYNVYYGASTAFGVAAWHFYLLGELGLWGGAAASVLLLAALGARRMPVLLAVAITILAVHSAFAHKEHRFVYPAVLLVMISTGIGLAQLASWGQGWLRARGAGRKIAALGATAAALGWWVVVALKVWTGPALADYRNRGHDRLAAVSFVAHGAALCGLGLYGLNGEDWANYGGYTYLHRSVPVYWPKDKTELAEFAAAFDTLVYTKSLPKDLGFTMEQCFGSVCVARRSGGCTTVPMMAMPFPDTVPRPVN